MIKPSVMKKIVLSVTLIACLITVNGQTSDTIGLWYPNYMFNTPKYGTTDSLCITNGDISINSLNFGHGMYFLGCTYEVSNPTVIYGIAMGVISYRDPDIAPDSSFSAAIYVQDSTLGFVKEASKPFHRYPLTKYFDLGTMLRKIDAFATGMGSPWHRYTSMVEFYFDTPVTVNGTFIVGATAERANTAQLKVVGAFRKDNGAIAPITGGEYVAIDEYTHSYVNGNPESFPSALIPESMSNSWPMLFPIVVEPVRDTPSYCHARVRGFRFSHLRIGYPYFTYDSTDGQYDYEVQYARANQSWDSATSFHPAGSPFGIREEFDSTIMYKARMRTYCRHACPIHDTLVPGEWGLTEYFHTGIQTPDNPDDTTGIAVVAEASPTFFTLTPNPTDGRVTVEVKSEKLKDKSGEATITLCDATGRKVLKQKASAPTTLLDLSKLPAGTYFVTVTIGGQSGTRKLAVK